jgi:hypothetical protein
VTNLAREHEKKGYQAPVHKPAHSRPPPEAKAEAKYEPTAEDKQKALAHKAKMDALLKKAVKTL